MFSLPREKILPRYSNVVYTSLHEQPERRRRYLFVFLRVFVVVALIAGAIAVAVVSHVPRLGSPRQLTAQIPTIPKHFRTVGLVFYGRRSRVEVLDCYLKVLLASLNRGSIVCDLTNRRSKISKKTGACLMRWFFLQGLMMSTTWHGWIS